MTIVTGTFDELEQAQHAIDRIAAEGLGRSEFSLMMTEKARTRFVEEPGESRMTASREGAGIGGAVGGTVGALLGGLAAVGAIAVPGVGLLVAGPLVALLSGAGAGGAAGGIVGALIGLGVSKGDATRVERHLTRGGVVVTADVDPSDAALAQRILRDEHAHFVNTSAR